MTNRSVYRDGVLIRSVTIDPVTGDKTIYDNGATTVQPATADEIAEVTSADREQRQLDRLEANFQALRAAGRLDRSLFSAANRPLADAINDQRQMILDLTRLVRGLAAED